MLEQCWCRTAYSLRCEMKAGLTRNHQVGTEVKDNTDYNDMLLRG